MIKPTDAELEEWNRLCEEATAGPWEVAEQAVSLSELGENAGLSTKIERTVLTSWTDAQLGHRLRIWYVGHSPCYQSGIRLGVDRGDARFIAAARTAMPRLIAALRESREAGERLGEEVEVLRTQLEMYQVRGPAPDDD